MVELTASLYILQNAKKLIHMKDSLSLRSNIRRITNTSPRPTKWKVKPLRWRFCYKEHEKSFTLLLDTVRLVGVRNSIIWIVLINRSSPFLIGNSVNNALSYRSWMEKCNLSSIYPTPSLQLFPSNVISILEPFRYYFWSEKFSGSIKCTLCCTLKLMNKTM